MHINKTPSHLFLSVSLRRMVARSPKTGHAGRPSVVGRPSNLISGSSDLLSRNKLAMPGDACDRVATGLVTLLGVRFII